MLLKWNIQEPADLRGWNVLCYVLHLGQAIAAVIYTTQLENARNFRTPLQTNYAIWNKTTGPAHANQNIAEIPFAALACAVPFISFLAHFLLSYDWAMKQRYEQSILQFYNTARWVEYAVSSTLMFFLICLLFSIYDLTSLLALSCMNATTMYCGYLMEQGNRLKLQQLQENYTKLKLLRPDLSWTPFTVGASIGIVQWALLYSTFSSIDNTMPIIIWALIFTYFILYMVFAVNMAVMYWSCTRVATTSFTTPTLKYAPRQLYYISERVYMMLSLTSKSILVWLIMFGVNQPNPYTK